MKKSLLILTLCVLTAVCVGCSPKEVQSQGRDYGEVHNLEVGGTMSTAFFDMNVNSASLAADLDGYVPENEGDSFLVVNITVKNTFDKTIPMSDADFELGYDGADASATIFPEGEFAQGQLAETYEIAEGDSVTGDLIYVVPGDAGDFQLYYYDLWEDNFKGDEFWLPFALSA